MVIAVSLVRRVTEQTAGGIQSDRGDGKGRQPVAVRLIGVVVAVFAQPVAVSVVVVRAT